MLRLFKKTPSTIEEFDLLQGSISIPLTTAQTNPTNPTKYITEYSKEVKLPLTPHNLQLMDFYTELDSVIVTGNYTPTVAIPIVVMNDNDIVFEGKLKLEKVNNYKGNRSMECTLYGAMNDFFNKMLNTTYWYDALENDTHINSSGMKVLDNPLDTGYNICKETVLESWKTQPYGYSGLAPHVATLTPQKALSYNPSTSQSHSIIAWAPTEQGQYANFHNDQVIVGGYTKSGDNYNMNICYGGTQDGTLVNILGTETELRYITVDEENKALAQAVLDNGLSERQWCQYRSYYQKPTVYINHLWSTYKSIAEETTGLKLELDEDWFNTANTRYTDLVYTLPDLQQEKKKESGGDSTNIISFADIALDCHEYAFGSNGAKNGIASLTSSSSASVQNGNIVIPAGNTGYCNFKQQLSIYLRRHGSLSNNSSYSLCYGDGTSSSILVQVAFENIADSSDVNTYNFRIVDENDTTWVASTVDTTLTMGTQSWNPDPQTLYFPLEGEVLIGQNNTNADKTYRMVLSVYCYNGNIDGGGGQALFQSRGRIANINALCQSCGDNPVFTFHNISSSISISQEIRSEFPLEMKDLFPANYSPFNILLQYTKLFNLVWDYNQLENKVTVMTREKWFSKYKDNILDWTDKVDTSKEFYFKPLAWDKKHVLFNYNDFEMDWLKTYKDTYGIPYGSKRITTQYNFNNETEELLCTSEADKINPSIMVSMSRFPLEATLSDSPSALTYNETFIANRKEDKSANVWGQFYFRNRLEYWDTNNGKTNIYTNATTSGNITNAAFRDMGICIVDDTKFQVRRNIFAVDLTVYASSMGKKVNVPYAYRPVFSVYDRNGEYSCQFSKPAMTFYNTLAPEMSTTMTVPNPLMPSRPFTIRVPFENNAVDVYTDRWSRIIEEQYNEQNKLLTCYVKLSDIDFRNLTCNRFVRIGNVLYSIYKVDDFQLGTGGLTKVTLLQVWEMRKYLGEYYIEPEETEPTPEPVGPDYTEPFYVENTSDEQKRLGFMMLNSSSPVLTIETSEDKENWTTLGNTDYNTTLTTYVPANSKLYLRCQTNSWCSQENSSRYTKISWYGDKVGGNIMSLLYGSNFNGQTEFPTSDTRAFTYLLSSNSSIIDASELLLPATTLTDRCYYGLFNYDQGLLYPPELPATTLAPYCYCNMFRYCTSLVNAPELLATTLVSGCYSWMFDHATSLQNVKCLATSGVGYPNTESWFFGISTTGTFTKAAGVTWPTGTSGIPSGWTVLEE